MRGNKKVADKVLEAEYARLQSVWRVAEATGMCGQSVHERLTRLGVMNHQPQEFTLNQQGLIAEAYKQGFQKGDGVLADLVRVTGKDKANICRWAKKQGLTNQHRSVNSNLAAAMGTRTREYIRQKGHPRGALGMSHTDETKARISRQVKKSIDARTPEQESIRILKSLQTRERNGSLYQLRPHASWKAAWRNIGGKRSYYRSRWEANYARYLEFLKTTSQIQDWEHEPETFWFTNIKRGVRSYLPDFRVTRLDGSQYYVEVKGWMDSRSQTKLKRMKKYHPQIEIELVDNERYKELAKVFKSPLSGWE